MDVDSHGGETGRVCSHVGCINVPLDLCRLLAEQHCKSGVRSNGDEDTIAYGVDGPCQQAYRLSELERVNNGKEKVDVGIPQYGLHSTWVGDGCYSSHGNLSMHLPSAIGMRGLPYFESGFSKGQVVLDFKNSTVSMSSAEMDIRKPSMFNDGSWLGLNSVTGSYRDDFYSCFFRQSGNVKTQGECSSNVFGAKEGYIYGGPSFSEATRTTNVLNIDFHNEGSLHFFVLWYFHISSEDNLKAKNSDEQGMLFPVVLLLMECQPEI
nr:hypothetical protein [Tanacetum cinerariifolium]